MKTFIFDLDGTLLEKDESVSRDVYYTLKTLSQENIIILATGRSYVGLPESVLHLLKYTSFIITSNGTTILDSSGNTLYKNHISKDNSVAFLSAIQNMSVCPELLIDGKWFIEKSKIEELHTCVIDQKIIGYIKNSRTQLASAIDFLNRNSFDVEKMTINLPINNRSNVKKGIVDIANIYKLKTWTDKLHKIDVYNNGTSKGYAIENLARLGYIRLDETICFGNDENDIEMFKICGFSFCMPNAKPEIAVYADCCLPQTNINRIVDAIQHYYTKIVIS